MSRNEVLMKKKEKHRILVIVDHHFCFIVFDKYTKSFLKFLDLHLF